MSVPPQPLRDQPVTALRGVGPERAALLGRLGVRTVADLVAHRPRRYEDRRHLRPIGQLIVGESVMTSGRVVAAGVKRWRHGTRSVFELVLEDGTGRLHCRWWNLPHMEGQFAVGEELVVYGKVRSHKPTAIDHPETEVVDGGEDRSIHVGRLVPVYPLTEGVSQRWLRGLIWRALVVIEPELTEPWPNLTGRLPLSHAQALRWLHFPEQESDAEAARQRLALEEFVALQETLQRRRQALETKARALPCGGDNRLMRPFLARLGFKLTDAQTAVLRSIRADLSGRHPMRRLLQGDVGSGKTVVAACAALMAVESGFEVAFMVPTEVLAGQQWARLRDWFEPLGVNVELHTGSRQIRSRPGERTVEATTRSSAAGPPEPVPTGGLPSGSENRPTLYVGTHALLEPGFAPARLGLVIIDEQHRFGVSQREELVRKGRYPHVLVMTATPIPRTLGLTLYGDLDVSVMDAVPAGRGRLRTFVRTADRLPQVWEYVREQLRLGRQAFVVYPRVEEAEPASGVKAVLAEFERLRSVLTPHAVGLLHGRMSAEEKDRVMAEFADQRVAVLVTTSVVEVGVDVPNASVMVIESAESFGLAQLHQLRGRVARSPHPASCILIATAKTAEAKRRLAVLEGTADGFQIAEADLQLRGPGELLGQAQSGIPTFRFGDLARDLTLIQQARELARELVGPATPTSASCPAPPPPTPRSP